jgi:signal transduction histidine kinase
MTPLPVKAVHSPGDSPVHSPVHSPMATRPVAWVAPVLYAAVLLGGLYYEFVGDEPLRPMRVLGFAGGLAVLLALDLAERRRYPASTPTGPAIALLVARLALFIEVTAFDSAGLSRALFVLVPFSAYFAFGRRAGIGLGTGCVAALVAWYALSVDDWYVNAEYVSDLLMFALGLTLALCMAAVAVAEQEARVRLEESHAELAAYAARVAELSTAGERNRLAREIHDSLGHHLTAIAIQLEKARAFRDRDAATADRALTDARWSADRALDEVRQSVRTLRAAAEPFSLSTALTDLVRHIDGDRMKVTLAVTGDETGYDIGSLTALYRAAQEGLTNAHRHAGARHASVAVAYGESSARLTITDDGRGMSAGSTGRNGFGLTGMRERVQLLGGDIDVASGPGAGTTITATVPRRPGQAR